MKRNDQILMLTRAALAAPAGDVERRVSLIGEMYIIDQNRKPNAVSLGAIDGDREETFTAWIARLIQEQILSIDFFYYAQNDQLPAHIAAAFAGPSDLLMQVTTKLTTTSYGLATWMSPRYEIKPAQFIALLNAQQNSMRGWKRVAELVLESNGMNNKTIFEPSSAPTYLLTPEGKDVFNYLVNNLLEEVQIDFEVNGETFIIPESLQPLFTKYETDSFFGSDDKAYVYLYPLRDVSAEELLALIDDQHFPEYWESLNAKIVELGDPGFVSLSPDRWPAAIMTMDMEKLQSFTHAACRTICELCETNHRKPVISKKLADVFGPNEEDQKRAAARSKGSASRWVPEGVKEPWEFYAFYSVPAAASEHPDPEKLKAKFSTALVQIQQFATKHESAFAEAFGLARFILSDAPGGDYDAGHIERIRTQLQQAGFSERAMSVFDREIATAPFLISIGFGEQSIRSLIAITVADVFGGMGSWNDQYFENDQEAFDKLSAELFDAMQKYFAGLLDLDSGD